jgi:hypothetical protein
MKMNNDQKKRAVTEFAALERDLDTILFRRRDDDEDRSSLPMAIAESGRWPLLWVVQLTVA